MDDVLVSQVWIEAERQGGAGDRRGPPCSASSTGPGRQRYTASILTAQIAKLERVAMPFPSGET